MKTLTRRWRPRAQTRLLLAFSTMVALTIAVGVVGWVGFSNTEQSLNALRRESLPEISQSMAVAERAAGLAALAPFIASVATPFQLDDERLRLRNELDEILTLVRTELPRAEGSRTTIEALVLRMEAALSDLIETTRRNLHLRADIQQALFGLATARREATTILARTNGLDGNSRTLRALIAIEGEARHLSDVMTAATTASSVSSLQILKSEFDQGVTMAEDHLGAVGDPSLTPDLREAIDRMTAYGLGPASVFAIRHEQLDGELRTSYLLALTRALSAQLSERVAALVDMVEAGAARRSQDTNAAVTAGKTSILALGAICVLAASFAAWYVVRDLGGNLAAVTDSMMRLASGNRAVEVPATDRPDEIGALARAFNIFKENAFERDRLARELSEKTKLLEATFDSMNDGLAVFDAEGRAVAWNPQYLSIYGLSEAAAGETPGHGLDDGLGDDVRREETLSDGRTVERRSNPMPAGGFVTIHTDLTERKATEEQLRQAQKMEIVGQLTGGVAHDFNNLLAAIVGNLHLLEDGLEDRPILQRRARRALDAADRGALLTQRLLAFSRRQTLQPRPTDLNTLVEGMLDLLGYSLGETIVIEADLAPGLWTTVIDPGQLENALLNLAINGRDAMPDGGRLRIETGNRTLDRDSAASLSMAVGDAVRLRVADTGHGMPPDVLARVFEPFFTTKDVGRGSGLGLSMVHGFVNQSGGHVGIESRPGGGTAVIIHLPRGEAREARSELAAPELLADLRGRDETVLVVEDDRAVRDVAVEMLEGLGYRTRQAEDGPAALALLGEDAPIDLIFTDVVLPGGMTGPDLVREATGLRPGLPALYCSGFTRDALIDEGRLNRHLDLIEKPYDRQTLARHIRTVLDRSGQTVSTSAAKT